MNNMQTHQAVMINLNDYPELKVALQKQKAKPDLEQPFTKNPL